MMQKHDSKKKKKDEYMECKTDTLQSSIHYHNVNWILPSITTHYNIAQHLAHTMVIAPPRLASPSTTHSLKKNRKEINGI